MENRDMRKVNPFVKQAAIKSTVGNPLGGVLGGYYGGMVGENSDLGFSRWGAAFAFRQISPVYRSVTLLASAVNSVPWRIFDQKTGDTVDHSDEYQPSHPVAKTIKNFRKTHDHGLFYFWESSRALYGVDYLEKMRNRSLFPAGLKWLNPLYVTNRVMHDRLIGFDYSRNRYQNFIVSEVSYDRIPDDASYNFDGLSPTMAAMAKINVDRNVLRTWGAFFRNGARPDTVIRPKDLKIFTEEQKKTIEQFWRTNLKGVDNAGRTAVFGIPFDMDTMDQPDLSKQIALPVQMEDDIYATYGVDRSVAGDTSALRYKAGNEVFGWFKSGILATECLAIQDEVNASIIPFFAERPDLKDDPERFRFEFEIGVFDETLQDAPAKQQSVLSNLGAGLITVNEARVEQGLDEIAGGDVLQWPSSATPVRLGGLDALTAPTPEGDDGGNGTRVTPAIAPDVEEAKAKIKSLATPTTAKAYGGGTLTSAIRAALLTQESVSYTTQAGGEKRCEGCRWFIYGDPRKDTDLESEHACQIVESKPDPIIPAGVCDRWEAGSPPGDGKEIKALSDDSDDGAEKELKSWQKFAYHKTHLKRDFIPKFLRGDVGDSINAGLKDAGEDRVMIKAVFEDAETRITYRRLEELKQGFIKSCATLDDDAEFKAAIKAIADTQKSFMDGFNNQINKATAGQTTRGAWSSRTRATISGWGRQAYIDGLADGGVVADKGRREDSVLSDEDKSNIKALNKAASKFVTSLGKEVFRGEGITDAQADQKAQQWWKGSILPYYNDGVTSANSNQMMEFVGDDGDESCVTCRKLKGQRHRMKHWKSKGFYPVAGNHKYNCECYQCQHELAPVKGRARGNWLKDAPGKWG